MITQEQIDARIAAAQARAEAVRKKREMKAAYRKRFMTSTQEGYDVRYDHFRYDKHSKIRRFIRGKSRWRPTLYGGLSVCVAVHRATGRILTGYGNCDPCDRFDYAEGRWFAWNEVYDCIQIEALKGATSG